MLSVIVPNSTEATVVMLTLENLRRELVGLQGGYEVVLAANWQQGILRAKGDYVCLVESDCLVSGGYFSSNMGLFKKRGFYRKLAMISSCTGLNDWGNRIYGYRMGQREGNNPKQWRIAPDRTKRSTGLYEVQVGFVPGAIIRRGVFTDELLKELRNLNYPTLVELSTRLSFHLWDTGRRVLMNPNTTYVSTDENLEKYRIFDPKIPDNASNIFAQEHL